MTDSYYVVRGPRPDGRWQVEEWVGDVRRDDPSGTGVAQFDTEDEAKAWAEAQRAHVVRWEDHDARSAS